MAQSGTLDRRSGKTGDVVGRRAILVTAAGLVMITLLVVVLGGGGLPFQRPAVAGLSFAFQLGVAFLQLGFAVFLVGVTYLVTRRRLVPDIALRSPARSLALAETMGMVAYAAGAQALGYLIGVVTGGYPISLHLPGTIYGFYGTVKTSEVFLWAVYNFAVYAAIPYLYFRRQGYTNEQLNLKSNNRRADLLLIGVILALQGTFDLVLSPGIFSLDARQLLIGAPAAFFIYFFGTSLPIMVFIYAILMPRYLRLTGSVAATVILGGLSYAAVHIFDSWAVFNSLPNAFLSLAFVTLQYFGPGMVKSFLTIRTANAWVHVWAYHAISPHVTIDTTNIVRIFGIR